MNAPTKLNAHLWDRHPEDWYIEPSWTSERLFAVESFLGEVCDPACGSGRILASAEKASYQIRGFDLVQRSSYCTRVENFLNFSAYRLDNIVSNPPFGIAQQFVQHALAMADRKVAMLLPTKWVQGDKRSRWLETTPLRRVLFLAPRPSMPPGPVIEAGISPGGGKEDFAWFIWHIGFDGKPECGWLRKTA